MRAPPQALEPVEHPSSLTPPSIQHWPQSLELWGGVECTVNRVGDQFFSQLDRNRHGAKPEDLVLIAELGIRAVRQPILWERVMGSGIADWAYSDACLRVWDAQRVRPIAGLLHHGSGPPHTDLLDPHFASKFADYAELVAARYPTLDWYTPVNEPLTTARFSAFYGIWYPHAKGERQFGTALLNECRATVLAMAAIRRINPHAKLLQTDDLGKCYSTPGLAYQADFNNEMRWLGWDLLVGTVDRHHALWKWLTTRCHLSVRDLMWFAEHPCPPAMLGVNHYVTSDRLLDENVDRYPAALHGGNGRDRYVDVEASRFLSEAIAGPGPLLDEAWARYRVPIAITECHIDSTRDEQMRWLAEVWDTGLDARRRGVDIRAVTVWALLGSYDWNCLLVKTPGYYEQGAFDTRGERPRPTAVARLMQEIARNGAPLSHPVLSSAGWWRRPERIPGKPVHLLPTPHAWTRPPATRSIDPSPVLIAGGSGALGHAFGRMCHARALNCQLLSRSEMDIADPLAVEQAINRYRPWAIINTAGFARIDDAEADPALCFRENTAGALTLAAICARQDLPLVTFSTDQVFDGKQRVPYRETDAVSPLNVYGRSKAEAESGVLRRHPGSLVVRTSALFGPWDNQNYVSSILQRLHRNQFIHAASDLTISPTYAPDLVNATLDLLIDGMSGIWHLANSEPVTWAELAFRTAHLAGIDRKLIRPCAVEDLNFVAQRPSYSALASHHPGLLPTLDSALGKYFFQRPKPSRVLVTHV
jgi:dTDP-4-dehydrorhamnose reductase